MIKLDSGNVLLKPSHRKQLMAWLRRSLRFGQRIGDFMLNITMKRIGRAYQVVAHVHDRAGEFHCRVRQADWRHAMRELVRKLSNQLHAQHVRQLSII
ncbi:MAG TPA: hypothetical protein VL282_13270 [Tepidisphaeraceae bacterium]|nr:hypothetical protein [Tepidisphaeraceae bacterium]